MGNKAKRFILCFLAVAMFSVSGTIYAEGEETDSPEIAEEAPEAEEQTSKLKESVETIKADYSEITEYLEKAGSAEGFDIYCTSKDIDDIIWDKNGGKPASKKDYTDAQKELSDKIDDLKKLGDFVAVAPDTKTVIADFTQSNKCDEGRIYVSSGKRFLLYTDSEKQDIIRIRQVISTIDDPYLFSSADGKTLERMDADYKKVLTSYTEKGTEDGRKVYLDDTGKSFAWLSTDGGQVIGTFREAAENEDFVLLVDDRLGNLGLKSKSDGYIWWSAPLEASRDKIATPLLVNELRSSNVLRYGIPSKRSNNNVLRSGTDDCEITVSDIKDGVKVTYDYKKTGFRLPVEYTLDGDCLKASLKTADIKEPDDEKTATEVTLLNSFGAGSESEDGYFVIPDGSGALVRFNSNKTMDTNAYQQRIYGSDQTIVPTSRGAVTEQIYLPVYGIVKDDRALLAVASKGDSNAYLTAQVSKQSNSGYNLCNFTFILRGTDTFYMSGNNSDKLTVFETGDILSDDIEVRYYPIAKKGADYTDIASRYRQYLTEEKGVVPKAKENSSPMYLDLYGGTLKKKPVFGIPVTMKQSITSYSEAETILRQLKDGGVEDINAVYNNWTSDGITHKVDTGASPAGKLGGKTGFKKLREYMDKNGCTLYPATDNRKFYSGNGYYSFTSTCVRVSGAYTRIVSYDRAYGIPDGFKKNMSLLSPSYFSEVCSDAAESYSEAGISGISISDMASSLYGDYGRKNISRFKAMELEQESFGTLTDKLENGIIADGANAYALPYVSHITNVPLSSSRFDIFNEDIPFCQMVLHGLIPYSTTPVNGDPDYETLLLKAAVTGSSLSYDMIYEETSTLKDTDFDIYYYANYSNWTSAAAEQYRLLNPVLRSVSGSTITAYTSENNGKNISAEYSNGTVISADLDAKTITCNGKTIGLDLNEKGGAVS